ncbi:Hypothetical predicted protein [Podarcis lilfordi]|uniref:Uncharacterized protein n=1 Tax=Podarcis lilfordi TaxID=74358 RepID=A0AA35K8Z2_9SAUR|nr:Hypothetical predicted protein [Podarcis lilfordi]
MDLGYKVYSHDDIEGSTITEVFEGICTSTKTVHEHISSLQEGKRHKLKSGRLSMLSRLNQVQKKKQKEDHQMNSANKIRN